MTKAASQKPFTAEVQLRKRLGPTGAPLAPATGESGSAAAGQIINEIRLMQGELRALHSLMRDHFEAAAPPAEAVEEATAEEADIQRHREELSLLKMELKALANSIQETKREIAALRSHDEDADKLNVVASELDAVVGATEQATDGILDAAEKIDAIAHNLKARNTDAYTAQQAEEIIEHIMTVFEHCNFQDITGQRINKVVNTLKFVEERVDKMIEIWGREAFEELVDERQEVVDLNDERHLLNGPALENQGISQDEIDKLFG